MAERQRQLEEQARRERQAHLFKAQPNLSKAVPPFVPARSSLPLTESREVPLETERRAKERAEFDAVMAEKEKMAQEYRHEMQEHVKVGTHRAPEVHRLGACPRLNACLLPNKTLRCKGDKLEIPHTGRREWQGLFASTASHMMTNERSSSALAVFLSVSEHKCCTKVPTTSCREARGKIGNLLLPLL